MKTKLHPKQDTLQMFLRSAAIMTARARAYVYTCPAHYAANTSCDWEGTRKLTCGYCIVC